ncbi:Baeyer-Villiger monooxygenase [Paraconexibacter sp. AEG42_29]|uniref:Baeyer-Villiger monooxygenase n=1 Tax=Paraconexibacter sp. AEG42_29 TaxID=2997339 RepID=A0AAU7B3S2_9ACTN
MTPQRIRTAVIGAGFSGLGAAIALRRAGHHDFVVLERSPDVGGTWWDNTYPGCRCDVPSNLYSFSFLPNPDWPETFSPRGEIQRYLRRCAEDEGVLPHIRFGVSLDRAAWDEDAVAWRLQTSDGELLAERLITGTGGLVEPKLPEIDGLDSFAGRVVHTARWDHSLDLAGKRVGVIGTGSSSIQVIPELAKVAGHLDVFQRTPAWVLPHMNRRTSRLERALFRRFPVTQRADRAFTTVYMEVGNLIMTRRPGLFRTLEAISRWHLKRQLPDHPQLHAKLTPDYRLGCKRITLSNHYLRTFGRPHVELVTEGMVAVDAGGITTRDGVRHELDVLVLGTGFQVTEMPAAARVVGRDGRTLQDVWSGSPEAYLGTTVAGFPNLFTLLGPNTGLGAGSIVTMIEAQLDYAVACLDAMDTHRLATIEPREDVQHAFNVDVQQRSQGTVWLSGGCSSWYLADDGRNVTLWPDLMAAFEKRTRAFDLTEHVTTPADDVAARPEPVAV